MEQTRIRWYGLACIIGGLLFFALNITADLPIAQFPSIISNLMGVVLLLGLMGGPLGLLALRAGGNGRMGRVGLSGAVITLLGLLFYLVGVVYTSLIDPEMGIFYALGALLSGIGMLPLGIAALALRPLVGWRRFAPLAVGLYYILMIPFQIVFFIVPNDQPSSTLLAFWGLTWSLLGYAIVTAVWTVQDSSITEMYGAR
jgi:hypothetical protein